MKLKKLATIVLTSTLFVILSCGTALAGTTVQSGTKRYIVKFRTSSTNESQTVSKHSGKFKRQFKHVNAAVVDMTAQSLGPIWKSAHCG